MDFGFVRVAAIVPKVNVADCEYNASQIIDATVEAAKKGAKVIATPELGVTAYTCGDLFMQQSLLDAAENALLRIAEVTASCDALLLVGAPLRCGDSVYNCAVAISGGRILGVVPKTYLPNYKEFYEKRWFASATLLREESVNIGGTMVRISPKLIFTHEKLRVAVEICEDLWTPIPPSSFAAIAGANVIVNMSASNELIGKHDYLMSLIKQQSARCRVAYVYASSGFGESTTDLVFAGNAIVAENGRLLGEGKRFSIEGTMVVRDVDVELIENDRMTVNSFSDSRHLSAGYEIVPIDLKSLKSGDEELMREVHRLPFVPGDGKILDGRCEEIIDIQVEGLMRRLAFINCKTLVLGVSGGLDSTLALLVAVKAFDRLKLDRKGIYGITMPGFGTTGRTYSNAMELMKSLSITIKEIPIRDAVIQHFKDKIGRASCRERV